MSNIQQADGAVWCERRHGRDRDSRPFLGASADRVFLRDRARVIHSAAFRGLQGKTQILSIGEGDFYRTRLTHSLEVAQIASGICEHLKEKYAGNPKILDWIPAMGLIEAIGLAHDIGHPPFGPGGEVALNYYMWDKGGFEGNGQTLHIVSRLGEYSPQAGLNLTRRTMLGLLKYPALHQEIKGYPPDLAVGASRTLNINGWRPPKCVLDDDADAFEWILAPLPDADRAHFCTIQNDGDGHGTTCYTSFDASIMELADDIAYGVHDFEDAMALRLVSFREWKEAVAAIVAELGEGELNDNMEFYNKNLFSEDDRERKHAVSRLVNYFISNIRVHTQSAFETPLLRLHAVIQTPAKQELGLLKDFVFKYVIRSPGVQAMEFKGQQMLLKLFEVLSDNAERLLPVNVAEIYRRADNPQRVIADYLASMTDMSTAKRYRSLFSSGLDSFSNRF
jgi:dGTPase